MIALANSFHVEKVVSIEPDILIKVTQATTTQASAPWNLYSISSTTSASNSASSGHPYTYDDTAGAGAVAYVLDSGVTIEHPEFEGRAIKGHNSWEGTEEFEDFFGHGSHVAGIIGAKTYGVAKKSTIVDVKVVRGVVSVPRSSLLI